MERRLAVIVGTESYADPKFRKLVAPGSDVRALEGLLRDPSIGGFDTVEQCINAAAREVRVKIARAASDAGRNDTLLLYFSGHGVLDDFARLHLIGHDTDSDLLNATSISADFITEELDRCRSRRQIVILDCCHGGAFDRSRKSGTITQVNSARAFAGATEGQGRYLLSATDELQFAYEGSELIGSTAYSVFTRFIIEGLATGGADVDRDGHISLDDLHSYVTEMMSAAGAKQHPVKWSYRASGKVFIARNPQSRALDIRTFGALASDLQASIVSTHRDVRLGTVAALSKLVQDSDEAVADTARLALGHLAGDRDAAIAAAAEAAVETVSEIYAVPLVSVGGGSRHEVRTLSLGGNVDIEMVRVGAGRFLMGGRGNDPDAPEDQFPQHAVDLREFWIARTPTTIRQFARFANMSNYIATSERPTSIRKAFSRRNRRYEKIGNNWRTPFGNNQPSETMRDHPVVLVSWHDAVAFCKWVSSVTGLLIDLPTEAQWEKAARGTDGRAWPWGNQNPGPTLCNFAERYAQTTPVGAFSPDGDSPYGCVDMAGNVWEWTNSVMRPYPFADEHHGSTLSTEGARVLRGGSWRVKAYRVRCTFRKVWSVGECVDGHGFRIVVPPV